MTLIAAIPTGHGFIISADTQETIGATYQMPVRKLVEIPFGDGRPHAVLAGAGHGDLCDSLEMMLRRSLSSSPPSNIPEFISLCERQLTSFYDEDVKLCPDDADAKRVKFLFGVSFPEAGSCGVWTATQLRLKEARTWELFGDD